VAQRRDPGDTGRYGGACVEAASSPAAAVAVRDSKDPDGPKLGFAPDQWRAFTDQVKAGAFDPA
jgi:Domain of unknown function (DUF397)